MIKVDGKEMGLTTLETLKLALPWAGDKLVDSIASDICSGTITVEEAAYKLGESLYYRGYFVGVAYSLLGVTVGILVEQFAVPFVAKRMEERRAKEIVKKIDEGEPWFKKSNRKKFQMLIGKEAKNAE